CGSDMTRALHSPWKPARLAAMEILGCDCSEQTTRQRETSPALQSAEYRTPGVVPSAVISKRPCPPPNSGTVSVRPFRLLQNSFTFSSSGGLYLTGFFFIPW